MPLLLLLHENGAVSHVMVVPEHSLVLERATLKLSHRPGQVFA